MRTTKRPFLKRTGLSVSRELKELGEEAWKPKWFFISRVALDFSMPTCFGSLNCIDYAIQTLFCWLVSFDLLGPFKDL